MNTTELFLTGLDVVGLSLDHDVVVKELTFLQELLRWNRKINLTSITDVEEAIEKHLLDSLCLINYLPPCRTILDMGSGAGLPGIPLALALPELGIVSVDSVGKKINFQKHIKRIMKLERFVALEARVETLATKIPAVKIDLVTARAFTSIEQLIKLSSALLEPGGFLLAMKGPEGYREVQRVHHVVREAGFSEPEIIEYKLPFSSAERQLLLLRKNHLENRG
ncbi:MAG: 16S rRNA (guanine(527)-N(7))-methyltransferase RsmG [Deltaproteobacteria bacterium]|jgi:16S rRNA (guanine527-N7)-methyltransferase|nr:16S rRNA (guanine(527)-N(7))-methyltransferase RsmG [Deltaproteobacteria bacterium]MCW8893451.1 16S rRNA (guanine(527)-N(7))-methyltransferase RsmG [Deltaproteobacteria bacterium]MCW9050634.1 16S rRNA (guanine(527)-N(7))-methyltransferase RsmG [Deltaproteobacteria bacterium]